MGKIEAWGPCGERAAGGIKKGSRREEEILIGIAEGSVL